MRSNDLLPTLSNLSCLAKTITPHGIWALLLLWQQKNNRCRSSPQTKWNFGSLQMISKTGCVWKWRIITHFLAHWGTHSEIDLCYNLLNHLSLFLGWVTIYEYRFLGMVTNVNKSMDLSSILWGSPRCGIRCSVLSGAPMIGTCPKWGQLIRFRVERQIGCHHRIHVCI